MDYRAHANDILAYNLSQTYNPPPVWNTQPTKPCDNAIPAPSMQCYANTSRPNIQELQTPKLPPPPKKQQPVKNKKVKPKTAKTAKKKTNPNCGNSGDKKTKSKRQLARNSGQEYYDWKGKKHEARSMKECACSCGFNCNKKFTYEQRHRIFTEFWALADYNLQTSFIFSSIIVKDPQRHRPRQGTREKKKVSVEYSLVGQRVCKNFFLATIDETHRRVLTVVQKKVVSLNTLIPPKDLRGRGPPSIKISQERLDMVKEHIKSFLPQGTTTEGGAKVLPSYLNAKLMYNYYKELCTTRNMKPVSLQLYRKILNTLNVTFDKKKK